MCKGMRHPMPTQPTADTGNPERFDPATDGDGLMSAEHVARYHWASQLTAARDVLDAGSGTGYGTAILADTKPSRLLAIDVAEEAVQRTQAAVGDRAEVMVADVRDLPIADGSVDLAVCFEVIEHLDLRDEAIRELARVLRPDGLLLISSPNRNQYPAGNEHHVYEYTPDELEHELARVFANVDLYRQCAWLGTLIATREELTLPSGLSTMLYGPQDVAIEETFTVAIAGNGQLPRPEPRAAVGDTFDLKWWNEQLNHLRRAALAAERELERRDDRLQALGQRLIEVEQGRAVELERVHHRLEQFEQWNADLKSSLSWRVTAPLRRAKGLLRRR
jgi:SAM-dependent methyltransferase